MSQNAFAAAIAAMSAINTAPEKAAVTRTGTKVNFNPEGMTLRVYKDGRVFPSQELVDTFNLEYRSQVMSINAPTPEETVLATQSWVGNGLDIFLAHSLQAYPKEFPNGLLLTVSPKTESKVDLFKTTDYNEDGSPKTSVMNQAPTTFGKDRLIPMLETVLGKESAEIFAEQRYVDIQVDTNVQLPLVGDFLYIPKAVVRGERKGELELTRRGKQAVYVCSILPTQSSLTEQEVAEETEGAEQAAYTTPSEAASTPASY